MFICLKADHYTAYTQQDEETRGARFNIFVLGMKEKNAKDFYYPVLVPLGSRNKIRKSFSLLHRCTELIHKAAKISRY